MQNNLNDRKYFDLNWLSKYRDGLYGVSIIAIMIFHFGEDVASAVRNGVIEAGLFQDAVVLHYGFVGSIGVEVFVFLSGMGLYYSFSKNSNIKEFYAKRFKRILIPYLIVAVIFYGLKNFYFVGEGLKYFVADVTFYTFFTRGVATIWFIGLMIAMYIIFPLLYRLMYESKHNVLWFAVLILLAAALPVLIRCYSEELYGNTSIATTRVPIFLAGAFIAQYIKGGVKIPRWSAVVITVISTVCGALAAVGGFPSYISRYLDSVFALGVIIFIAAMLYLIRDWDKVNRVFAFCGKYSLELYMCHVTMRRTMSYMGFEMYRLPQYLLMIALSFVAAMIVNRAAAFIEKKLFG